MEVRVGMDEKLQAILWTERPTGALVGTGSHWPINSDIQLTRIMSIQPCPFPLPLTIPSGGLLCTLFHYSKWGDTARVKTPPTTFTFVIKVH
jgi:hypothetical protein